MTKIKSLCITVIASIIMFSCVSNPSSSKPPIVIEDEYLNNQVLLHVLKEDNTFITGEVILLRATFRTDTDIIFPNNYNLRLFVWENKGWREIYEKPGIRLPEGDFVFSPATSHQLKTIFVEPDFGNYHQKYYLRIYVSGKMMDDGEFQTVASFADIVLKP